MNNQWTDLLQRQLKRSGLSAESLPGSAEEWLGFLERVNRSYAEVDQERYLLERSMTISSNEMSELNEKLENAQRIAELGYWHFDTINDKIFWSDQLRILFGYDSEEPPPSLEAFLELTLPEDRKIIIDAVNKAKTDGKDYDIEIRVKHKKTGEYRWFRSICRPNKPETADAKVLELSGVVLDINNRKHIESQMRKLNNQLLASARSVGMAEVATDVLHNVGNVLNSVNVCVDLLNEKMQKPLAKKIQDCAALLDAALQKTNYAQVVDDKEKLLLGYLTALTQNLAAEQVTILQEIKDLDKHIQHINDIVSSQQSLAKVADILEKLVVPEIIELALEISFPRLNKNDVDIHKTFSAVPPIISDKSKLLQILVNILQNARDSVLAAQMDIKTIVVSVAVGENDTVVISVQDNGVGISIEDITRIFAFGFTTKPDGHGFGLHMSAIAAKDLGGSLMAASAGLGQGATFTLTLPISANVVFKEVVNE